MSLFNDRRTGTLHDLGTSAPPTDYAPEGRMAGWASAAHDVQLGRAALVRPAAVPPSDPYAVRTNIVSPAEQRAMLNRENAGSRTSSWGGGSHPWPPTVLPAAKPGRVPRTSTVGTGFLAQRVKSGPSFARRAPRTR